MVTLGKENLGCSRVRGSFFLLRFYLMLLLLSMVLWFSHPGWTYLAIKAGVHIPVSVIFIALLVFLAIIRMILMFIGVLPLTKRIALVYGTLLILSLRVSIGYFLGEMDAIPKDLLAFALVQGIAYAWFLSVLGEGSAFLMALHGSYWSRGLAFAFAILVMSLLYGTATSVVDGRGVYFDFAMLNSQDGVFNYQTLGDSLAMVAILLFGHSFVAGLLVTPLLALSYSRTSLLAYLLALVMIALVLGFRWRGFSVKRALINMIIVVALINLFILGFALLQERAGELVFIDRALSSFVRDDASIQERMELFNDFLDLVLSHGLLGSFLYEVQYRGPGMYVHNILSYWLEYGIIPFISVMGIIVLAVSRAYGNCKRTTKGCLGLMLAMFVVISVLFSRAYLWPYLWYGLAFSFAWSAGVNKR